MGATIALRLTARTKEHGDFTTGLYLWEGSSSDPISRKKKHESFRPRDLLSGIPVLWWTLTTDEIDPRADRVLEVTGQLQSIAIGAVEFDQTTELPFAAKPVPSAMFRVVGGHVELLSHVSTLGIFSGQRFPIHPRLAWFLALGGTLSVVVETPSKTTVATFTNEAEPPKQIFHEGTLGMKHLTNILEHSTGWVAGGLWNLSLLAGMDEVPDHHVTTYVATQTSFYLPDRISYRGVCISCGAAGDSKEHCIPNWIARDHNVVPVTAPLFCTNCNHHFGRTLEAPMADHSRESTIPEIVESDLFALWAVKTALTLSAASDVLLDDTWMRSLRTGSVPDGFQVFAHTDGTMEPGYMFSVTHFSRAARRSGIFLFSFAIHELLFVVLRTPDELLEIAGIDRVRPAQPTSHPLPAQGVSLDMVKLHDHLVEVMTGHAIHRPDEDPSDRAAGDSGR